MLTGLRLGNFKAFGETQNIPIKPLTLIFGANSAGKSSIIQGLLLARHANETGNLDVYKTTLGGETVDLGGFKQYVHRRNQTLAVIWGVEVNVTQESEQRIFDVSSKGRMEILLTIKRIPIGNQDSKVISAIVVEDCQIKADGKTLLRLRRRSNGFTLHLQEVDEKHPGLVRMWEDATYNHEWSEKKRAEIADRMLTRSVKEIIAQGSVFANRFLSNKQSFIYADERSYSESRELPDEQQPRMPYSPQEFKERSAYNEAKKVYENILSSLVGGLEHLITHEFSRLSYLGPLRTYPPRHLAFQDDQSSNWFAGGGIAWEIMRTDPEVRTSVNWWLGKHLQAPYELLVRRYSSQDSSDDIIEELVLRDKRFDTLVSHRDIGVGISQVLPVLVSAYGSKNAIVAIEQPEIHLHPALQAELGDVFIESALGERKNTFLLETHSEHLILRIMRRMRDTVRGTLPEGIPPVRPEDVAVLYVDRKDDDSTSVVSVLELDEEGQLLDPWPGGFFEEGFNERFA